MSNITLYFIRLPLSWIEMEARSCSYSQLVLTNEHSFVINETTGSMKGYEPVCCRKTSIKRSDVLSSAAPCCSPL